MNALKDRVCVITGAGRGIGREHALLFAAEGAKVVVNDLGGQSDGTGTDSAPAQHVVDEIVAKGGQAVANYDDVADWNGAKNLVSQAIEAFGDLHVLVNNAGILRDRMLVNMSDLEWDSIMRVHLRGHFCPTRWAAAYWRDQSKQGSEVKRSVINTSSTSGLFGNIGQANYGAAKTGIATFTIIANAELAKYGVRVNSVAPAAATRLTRGEEVTEDADAAWDPFSPSNISPFVGYLATTDCPISGRNFFVQGGGVFLFQPFVIVDGIEKNAKWSIDELKEAAPKFQEVRFAAGHPLGDRVFATHETGINPRGR